jgi:hypothetical protein
MIGIPRQLNRREALIGTGLVGAGALAAMLSGCGASGADAQMTAGQSQALQGTWRVAVTVDDGSHHDALMNCAADGGVATVASLPPSMFAGGFGAWSRSGANYLLTFQAYLWSGSGGLDMLLRIHGLVTIDQSGDGLAANVKYDVAPNTTSSFKPGGTATWTGSRIKPLAS